MCVYMFLKVRSARIWRISALARKRRRARARRRMTFARKQAQQHLFFVLMMSLVAFNVSSPARSIWMKERSSYWWNHIVSQTFSAGDWLDNFRMSRATFIYVCNELRSAIEKNDTEMRNAVPVELRVALTLWFCTIGHLFGVSKPTVCVITKEVCAAIVKVLLPKYVPVPSGDELKKVVEGRLLRDFGMNWGFHNVQGWLMEHTIQLYLQLSVLLITITEKVGIRSSYKEWLTMSVDSLGCTLGGLEECMMRGY